MRPQPHLDERALVLRAQDGETAAFEQLVDRHQGRLFRIAFMVLGDRQEAEDVVQEALVLTWKRLDLLEDPDKFRGWVSRITTRSATDVVRRRARRATDVADSEAFDRPAGTDAAASALPGTAPPRDPADTALVNAQMQALAGILSTLDPGQRACWVLREIDGMSYREIGQILDASEATVRGRIARARHQIVDRMQEWR